MPVPPAVMPVVPAVPPATVPMVPTMPAVSPAAVPAPSAVIVRVVVTVAVARLMPAVAPCVADESGLLDVGSLRDLTGDGNRHRRCGGTGERHAAEHGEANKCRNKFHVIFHL